jgi:uncharacterized protein involved in outer membrane biogenesis
VAASTGRELVLAGDMSGQWSFTPTLAFREVRFENPQWATQRSLLEAEEVTITLSLSGLLRKPREIEAIQIRGARVGLESGGDERRSWRLDLAQSDPASAPILKRVMVDRGEVRYLDAASQTDVLARIGSIDQGGTTIDVEGRARGTQVALAIITVGTTEALAAATDPAAPSPALRGKGTLGGARVTFSGSLGPGHALNGTRFKLSASGPDLSALRPLARMAIPATPPYRIDADVAIDAGQVGVVLRPSTFGGSRLQGRFDVIHGGDRLAVIGKFAADPLDIGDLGPLLGAAASKTKETTGGNADHRRLLPGTPFDTSLWPSADLDLTLDATRVTDAGRWAIDAFRFRALLERGTLTVSPLSVSMADGRIEGNLAIERKGASVALRSDGRFSRLQLARLLPSTDTTRVSTGAINGRFDVAGQGSSLAAVMGASDGHVSLVIGSGQVSNLLLEIAGLDGGEAVRFLLGGDRRAELRCAVASLPIRKGMVTAEAVVIDTDDTLIAITGGANLKEEQMSFTMHAQPKDWSLFSVRSPIHLRGPFSAPQVSVDRAALGLRAAGAILLGLINPLAALIPLIETGGGEDADCKELISGVQAGTVGKALRTPATGR